MNAFTMLGSPIKEFKRSGQAFRKILILSLISLTVSAIIFYGAFFGRGIDLSGRIVLSILGLFVLLPAMVGLYMIISRSGSSVVLYQEGLVHRRRGKEFSARWDEIESVTESSACRIAKKNGEAFDFGENVEGYEEITEVVREETLKRILPQVKEAISSGKSVVFPGLKLDQGAPLSSAINRTILGKEGFTVDSQGISTEGHSIAWSNITEFGLSEGERRQVFPNFFVQSPELTLKRNVATLPNAHVLLALCEEWLGRDKSRGI